MTSPSHIPSDYNSDIKHVTAFDSNQMSKQTGISMTKKIEEDSLKSVSSKPIIKLEEIISKSIVEQETE